MKNFGGIMKAQMTRLGIKQEKLAKELNIARTTVTAYCNNKRQPDLDTLTKICHILQINLTWLMDIPDIDNSDMFIRDDFEVRVNKACRRITQNNQQKFLEGVEYLADLLKEHESES